ncbi:MAG: hypothetical protein K6E35_00675 [Bacteroidales bacterium]|nr:hypothetical protein [Bacteroidales bacterium]
MKKKLILVFTLFAALSVGEVFAQGKYGTGADSATCVTNLSFYKEYFKQKNYDAAISPWRKAYKACPPTANQTMLIDGTTLLRRLISKNANNAEYCAALVDTLLTIHDTRAKYYSKYTVTTLNNKGTDMINYVKNDSKKLYDGLEGIIANNQEQVRPSILLFDMQAAADLYQAGNLDAESVINLYQRNSDLLEKITPENDSEKEQIANIKTDMGNLFAGSKVASCESLIELYTPRLAAEPENLQLAQSVVKTMGMTEGCDENDLFLQAVTTVNKLDPSPSSSYYLFRLHGARGNVKEAIEYMEASIAGEEDAARKADRRFELARFCFLNGENERAYDYATQVVAESESLAGKAYFLMGNIWASVRCGGDEIARRAPYWAACDYMNKAKAADESLAEEANRYISQYSVYFPETAEAFMYDLTKGQSYTVVCGGLRATTTVRTR